jgi:LacI family transcriptional regulator
MYAIFIHAHDHVYEAQTRALVRTLQQSGALPLVFDVRDLKAQEQTEEILGRLLDQGIAGLVLEDGILAVLLDLCARRKAPPPRLAMVNRPAPESVPALNVITDFEFGTRLGTQHLLGLGHRNILFVCHVNPYLPPGHRPDQESGEYGRMARGYTGALFDAGLAGRERFFLIRREFAYGSDERERLKEVLSAPDRPSAVFAYGDYRAKHVIDIAAETGLRVPEDIAVIGYWNTPWADLTRVPLTSISIREDEIARLAVEKLIAGDAPQTFVVKPELVIRQSTGGMKQ